MLNKICNIFKEYHFGTLRIDNSCDLKEQIASLVAKPFLLSCYGERLTWESGCQNIKIRDIVSLDFTNILFDKLLLAKVAAICFAGGGIFFVSPNDIEPGL